MSYLCIENNDLIIIEKLNDNIVTVEVNRGKYFFFKDLDLNEVQFNVNIVNEGDVFTFNESNNMFIYLKSETEERKKEAERLLKNIFNKS